MALLGEILRADPGKIKFDGGKPPVIGEVPTHTYGMLLDAHQLELLDEPEDVLDDTVPDAKPTLSREEELRRELQGIASKYGIPTTAIVETEGQVTVFEQQAPSVSKDAKTVQPESEDKPKKQPLPINQRNRANNMKVFSGRLGRNVFEKGVVVNKKL